MRWLKRWLARKDLAAPAGCCECGTGGRYHDPADGEPLTRYVYVDAMCGSPPGTADWTACSAHPLEDMEPVVDYGQDVVVTIDQAYADVDAALQGAGT